MKQLQVVFLLIFALAGAGCKNEIPKIGMMSSSASSTVAPVQTRSHYYIPLTSPSLTIGFDSSSISNDLDFAELSNGQGAEYLTVSRLNAHDPEGRFNVVLSSNSESIFIQRDYPGEPYGHGQMKVSMTVRAENCTEAACERTFDIYLNFVDELSWIGQGSSGDPVDSGNWCGDVSSELKCTHNFSTTYITSSASAINFNSKPIYIDDITQNNVLTRFSSPDFNSYTSLIATNTSPLQVRNNSLTLTAGLTTTSFYGGLSFDGNADGHTNGVLTYRTDFVVKSKLSILSGSVLNTAAKLIQFHAYNVSDKIKINSALSTIQSSVENDGLMLKISGVGPEFEQFGSDRYKIASLLLYNLTSSLDLKADLDVDQLSAHVDSAGQSEINLNSTYSVIYGTYSESGDAANASLGTINNP